MVNTNTNKGELNWATLVRAPIEQVYDAFATGEGQDGWWTDGATIEAWPGGEVRFPWEEWGPDKLNDELVGKVIEVEKPDIRIPSTASYFITLFLSQALAIPNSTFIPNSLIKLSTSKSNLFQKLPHPLHYFGNIHTRHLNMDEDSSSSPNPRK